MRAGRIAAAVALVALAGVLPAATGATAGAGEGASRAAVVATAATQDFRVAVVAHRLKEGGAIPAAEVRVGLARRVGGRWRELGEVRLGETYFWNTLNGPRAVCRLSISTAGSRPSFRPSATVQLLLSPSLGCGRTHRIPLEAR